MKTKMNDLPVSLLAESIKDNEAEKALEHLMAYIEQKREEHVGEIEQFGDGNATYCLGELNDAEHLLRRFSDIFFLEPEFPEE